MNINDDIHNYEHDFITKINELLTEISKIKQEVLTNSNAKLKKKITWKSEYDDIYNSLKDIAEISQFNIILAKNNFRNLEISNFTSFKNYLKNKDINLMSLFKGSNERTKLLRAKRKNKICPECKTTLISSSGTYICKKCGYKMQVPANEGKGGKGKKCLNCGKYTVFDNVCSNCGARYK